MKRIAELLLLILCVGCANQKYTRRYAKLDSIPPPNSEVTKHIAVIATARDVPQPPPVASKYVLTDHGQAAYIQALAAKAQNMDDFQGNLFPDVSGLDKPPSTLDNTIFTKRLLMTVLDHSPYEADRITHLKITIKLDSKNNGLKLLTFDKITTEYQTVDLGSISQTNALSATAGLSYGLTGATSSVAGATTSTTTTNPDGSTVVTTAPATTTGTAGPTAGASLSATYSNSTTEQVNLKNRYVALTGYPDGDDLVFEENSESGVNLAGNIISDIKFELTGKQSTNTYTVSNLDKSGVLTPPEKVKVRVVPVFEAAIAGALNLQVTYEFEVRHVINESGQRTISEADDEIGKYTDKRTTKTDMTLVANNELTVKKWEIATKDGNVLLIKDRLTNDKGTMYFTSYDSCLTFYKWLKKSAAAHADFSKGDFEFLPSGSADDLIKNATVVLAVNPKK